MATSYIDKIASMAADNFRVAKSKTLIGLADGSYSLIRIPKYAFVFDVFLNITTAYSSNGSTVTVGWTMGTSEVLNGFISNDVAEPWKTGLKRAMADTLVTFTGKWFNTAGGMITLTTDDNADTAGTMQVFAIYSVIH